MWNSPKIKKDKNNGFTLLEVITAIFIIVIGVGGAVALINQTINLGQTISSRLIANYLAQEGIEVARNIRDSNFLDKHKGGSKNWDDGLGCAVGCEGNYSSSTLFSPYNGEKLKVDSGFYSYSGSGETKFQRKITINPVAGDILEVVIDVFWQEKGKSYQVTARENLYKWW